MKPYPDSAVSLAEQVAAVPAVVVMAKKSSKYTQCHPLFPKKNKQSCNQVRLEE